MTQVQETKTDETDTVPVPRGKESGVRPLAEPRGETDEDTTIVLGRE